MEVRLGVNDKQGSKQETDSSENYFCTLLHALGAILQNIHYIPAQSASIKTLLSEKNNQSLLFDYFISSPDTLEELIDEYQTVLCFFTPAQQQTLYELLQKQELFDQLEFSIRMEVQRKIESLVSEQLN